MKKKELKTKTAAVKDQTKLALETILENLNKGQRKKVTSVAEVKALCERYGVEIAE